MIKWILFDQAGVQTHPVFSRKSHYSFNGRQFSAKELESIFYIPEYKKFSIGKISEKELISSFLEKNKMDVEVEDFIEIFKKGIEAIEGMEDILDSLSQKYSLATLINEGSPWAHYKLEISDFERFFKENFISGDLGVAKPDPEIYLIALKRIGVNPKECIFIDDQKKNCEAAEKLGIISIVFESPLQLKKELANFSIEIE